MEHERLTVDPFHRSSCETATRVGRQDAHTHTFQFLRLTLYLIVAARVVVL